jgi:TolB-like protein
LKSSSKDLRALVPRSSSASVDAPTAIASAGTAIIVPPRVAWLAAIAVVILVSAGSIWSMRGGGLASVPRPAREPLAAPAAVVPPAPSRPNPPDPRPSIAALEFQSPQVRSEFTTLRVGIADAFTDAFARSGRFRVVERTQLDKAITELDLSRSAYGDPGTAQRVGRLIGAQYLIVGSFQIVADQIRLNARLVRVGTGEIVHAEAVTGKSADALQLPDRLVQQFLQAMP